MGSPAENAATVREGLQTYVDDVVPDPEFMEARGNAWFVALAALLAQAETAAENEAYAESAEFERDAAVRAAEQAQEALRPFVEDYDFHAAGYLSDDDEARVFTARTVESLIAHQRAARAALTGEGPKPTPRVRGDLIERINRAAVAFNRDV